MTCIVGLASEGSVYIGGDSAGVSGYDIVKRSDPKVFSKSPFVMGFCGSFRMGQLLMFALQVPEQTSKQDDKQFMCTSFINAVRDCLKRGGYAKAHEGVESGGTFIVGYHGEVYTIYDDFQVEWTARGYTSVGSGESYAFGSLWETKKSKLKPRARILRALKCSEEHSAGVRRPFKVVIGGKK